MRIHSLIFFFSFFLFSIHPASAGDVSAETFISPFWLAGVIMFTAGMAGAYVVGSSGQTSGTGGIGFVGGAGFGLVLDWVSGIVDAVYLFVLALVLVAMAAMVLGKRE